MTEIFHNFTQFDSWHKCGNLSIYNQAEQNIYSTLGKYEAKKRKTTTERYTEVSTYKILRKRNILQQNKILNIPASSRAFMLVVNCELAAYHILSAYLLSQRLKLLIKVEAFLIKTTANNKWKWKICCYCCVFFYAVYIVVTMLLCLLYVSILYTRVIAFVTFVYVGIQLF